MQRFHHGSISRAVTGGAATLDPRKSVMKGVVVGDVVYADVETRKYLRGLEGLSPSLKAIGRDVSRVRCVPCDRPTNDRV